MPFAAFRREVLILALLHTAHWFAGMIRTGKWSAKRCKRLETKQEGTGKKAMRARKDIIHVRMHTANYLRRAKDILYHAGNVLEFDVL